MNIPDAQFKLRLPATLKERLDESAERSGRSLSAEIVHRLERSFEDQGRAPGVLGLRAELAAQREINEATAEMLARAVTRLDSMRDEDGPGPYPGQEAGTSVHEALADTEQALVVFRQLVDSATLLLSELAIAEAHGRPVDVEAFAERARQAGVL
ncbi:Arc family DNA-binding protein [Stenotrophomonas sp. NPDC078853]|uniref:Arc family DNA-binding protein n=1 Tax=Stenotrophomonas sp. NPDC078853 TaxID=3364534 RepID=UPI003850C7E3